MAWSQEDKLIKLRKLHREWTGCTKCTLHEQRTNIVFGAGDVNAKIFFVGEGPGNEEDLKGEPFIGASGKLMNDLLVAAGMRRNDVWITNLVMCHPPDNRDPTAAEKDACMPRLLEQIYIVDPLLIVAVGKQSMSALMGGGWKSIVEKQGQIGTTNFHGRFMLIRYPTVPILHPAYLLRRDQISKETGTWQPGGEVHQTLTILKDIKEWVSFLDKRYKTVREKLENVK